MKRNVIDIAAFVLMVVVAASSGWARQEGGAGFSSGGEIGLRISEVGLGNRARAGDWAAIQVEVLHRSSNPKPMEVIVRLDIPNDDGDRGMHQRKIVTNPNRPVTTWLYARIPFTFDSTSPIPVTAFLPFDQEAGDEGLDAYDPTKPVGSTSVQASGLISAKSGLIGVVGRRAAGVDRYGEQVGTSTDIPLTGHELTIVNSAITPAGLPDRVHGLRAFEALIWTGSGAEEQPGKLNVAQADAIREWVASGGHLVVVLPVVGQTWLDTPNPLTDIMPRVSATRQEGVSLEGAANLLGGGTPGVVPRSAIVQVLKADPAAGPYDAMPLMTLPTGETIAARRLIGIGAVTVIGLDLPNIESAGAVRADAFWNRVLGKRLWLPPRNQVRDGLNSGQLYLTNRKDVNFELAIPSRINRETKAALGLLVAVIVFGGFWLVAGPVGFFVLKQRSRVQHSWVAYVATIAVFTALSWGAATAMRQRTADAHHVTILDHVYGQPCQRARVWANVFLPSYGSARVSTVEKPFDLAGRALSPNPAIAPWEIPRAGGGRTEFPETRNYVVDARSPDSIDFPARATTRQLQIDWLGGPQWSMPLPQSATGEVNVPMGQELALANKDPRGVSGKWTVNGTLTHDLPSALRDVVIIVNRGQLTVGRLLPGQMTADAGIFSLTKPWNPKEPLDLAQVTHSDGGNQSASIDAYLDRNTPRESGAVFANMPQTSEQQELQAAKTQIISYLTNLSLYSMLAPPTPNITGDTRTVVRRQSTHTLDLGRWFTQPCVIVIGFVDGGCPVPLEVDGRQVPTDGLTAVRWVYPLPPAPPGFTPIDPVTSGGGLLDGAPAGTATDQDGGGQ